MLKKQFSTCTAVVLLGLAGACDQREETAEVPVPETPPAEEEAAEELADPSEVPQGLAELKLSKTQAAAINQWLAEQDGRPDPADYAKFVKSVLRDDQQDAFRKVLEGGG